VGDDHQCLASKLALIINRELPSAELQCFNHVELDDKAQHLCAHWQLNFPIVVVAFSGFRKVSTNARNLYQPSNCIFTTLTVIKTNSQASDYSQASHPECKFVCFYANGRVSVLKDKYVAIVRANYNCPGDVLKHAKYKQIPAWGAKDVSLAREARKSKKNPSYPDIKLLLPKFANAICVLLLPTMKICPEKVLNNCVKYL